MQEQEITIGMKVYFSAFRNTSAQDLIKPSILFVRGKNHTGNGWDLVTTLDRTPLSSGIYTGVDAKDFDPA